MNHQFNVTIAKEYGLLEAILLFNIDYWVRKNKANNKHFYDGRYWTYNSVAAFAELFPYATSKQIRTALDHLRKEGIICTGQYGDSFDKSLWYSVTDKGIAILHGEEPTEGKSICPTGQMDSPHRANDIYILNNNNNSSTNQNTNINNDFAILWKKYPRKEGRKKALEAYQKALKDGVTHEEISAGLDRYLTFLEKNEVEPQFIRKGSKWFAEYSWEDEYVNYKKQLKPGEIDWENA